MRETTVEKRLIKRVKDAGGMCLKIMPVISGVPDRLVLLPWGRFFFVETKAPKGTLRPTQEVFRRKLAAIGIPVAVLYTTKQVNDWVDARIGEEQQ